MGGIAASALQLANVLGVAFGTGVGGASLGIVTAPGHSQAYGIVLVDVLLLVAALLGLFVAGRSVRPVTAAVVGAWSDHL